MIKLDTAEAMKPLCIQQAHFNSLVRGYQVHQRLKRLFGLETHLLGHFRQQLKAMKGYKFKR